MVGEECESLIRGLKFFVWSIFELHCRMREIRSLVYAQVTRENRIGEPNTPGIVGLYL